MKGPVKQLLLLFWCSPLLLFFFFNLMSVFIIFIAIYVSPKALQFLFVLGAVMQRRDGGLCCKELAVTENME